MKKEELIEELKKEIEATKNVLNCEEHSSLYAKGKRIGLEFGWMLAEELDEPEEPKGIDLTKEKLDSYGLVISNKVAIPQFVADWIEKHKYSNDLIDLYSSIEYATDSDGFIEDKWQHSGEFYDWLSDDTDNIYLMVDAMRFGYTVKKEQLYYMKLKSEVANQLFLGSYKYLNVLIGESGQPYTFDKKTGYSSFFKTMLNREEVETWKNKLNALDFEIVEVTE